MNEQQAHLLEDRAAGFAGAIVRRLPRRVALALGRGLGRLLGDLDRRHVAIAADNLRRAFPHWDEPRVARAARAVYAHFGQVLFDILWLRGRSREEVMALVDIEGGEHPAAALRAGRGVLCATAHIGNWELDAVAHAWAYEPFAVVARPLDNPALDRRLTEFRTMSGNPVIYKQRALPEILRAIRGGGSVAMLIDQNVQERDGIFVDFFGRPAATTTVAAAVAVKTGCALIMGFAEARPNGRYRMRYEPMVTWVPSGSRLADIEQLTQKMTHIIEGWVREVPEQWLWLHRRWKTQPAEEVQPAGPVGEPAAESLP